MSQSSSQSSPQGPLSAGEVLNEAFQFALQRWGTVLRYAWLPALLCLGLIFLYSAAVFGDGETLDGEAAELSLRMPAFAAFLLGVVVFAACAYLYAGFMTSVFRLVATGEERGGFVHLRMDEPVIRVFWALLIVNAISIALLGLSIVMALIFTGSSPGATFGAISEFFALAVEANASDGTISPEATADLVDALNLVFLSILGAFVPIIYFNIRLTPFPAASAVENRLVLFGSFHLTQGRFWSIFFIQFLILVCLVALSVIVELGTAILNMLGGVLVGLGGVGALGGAAVLGVVFLIAVVFQVFAAAVQVSAQGIIYRRLKTGE